MERIQTKFIQLFLICTSLMLLASCGNDDEGANPFGDQLLGSWELTSEEGIPVDFVLIITFQSDGSYSEFFDDDGFSGVDTGTYSFIGDNRVQIDYGDGDFELFTILIITATRLVVEDEDGDEYVFAKV